MENTSVVDPVSTTAFVDKMPGTTSIRPLRMDLDPHLLSSAKYGEAENIYDFLAKPYPLIQGVFQSTDTSTTFTRYQYFQDILTLEPYASKLKGFMGIRADMVLKVVFNANSFQAGRYILAVSPHGGTGQNPAVYMENGTRFASLTQITQLPHVEFDLNTESSATLTVPYSSVYSHVPVNPPAPNTTHSLGTIILLPYSPVVSTAGSSSVPFDLYVSFTNVDLAAPVFPQMAKGSNTVEREQAAANIGPVAKGAGKVKALANMVGQKVPLLASIAEPVSWAMDLLEGAANIFGWSNPSNLAPAQRITDTAFAYANNADAGDNSLPISLYSCNQVEVAPGYSGTALDEMVLSHLSQIPAYMETITWSTANATGSVLYSFNLTPYAAVRTSASGASTVSHFTPVGLLSRLFQYYRGGLKFKFKIVKTRYHTGRLILSFNPSVGTVATPISSITDTTYLNRQVIDISTQTEFEYTVPFISLSPWKPTYGQYGEIGALTMVISNPLVAPATVSSSISILMEICGAEDIEFAVPKSFDLTPVVVYDPQAYDPRGAAGTISSGELGKTSYSPDMYVSSRACIGEKVVSLLSLSKKSDTSSTSITTGPTLTYYPHVLNHGRTTAGAAVAPVMRPDMLDIIRSMFLYNRGSLRVRYIPATVYPGVFATTTLIPTDSGTSSYSTQTTGAALTPSHHLTTYHNTNSGGVEVQIPQYHRFPMRIAYDDVLVSGAKFVDYVIPTVSQYQIQIDTKSNCSGFIARQAGDDFHCGFFLGVPPMIETEL